jgi:hypothetical protein
MQSGASAVHEGSVCKAKGEGKMIINPKVDWHTAEPPNECRRSKAKFEAIVKGRIKA